MGHTRTIPYSVLSLMMLSFSVSSLMLLHCGWGVAEEPTAVRHLDQGWTPGWKDGQSNWYHHASQGTMMLPYDWFMSLEQPSIVPTKEPQMFSDPAYLQKSFGFLPSVENETYNPGDLPVGFAIAKNWVDPNNTTTKPPVTALGLTCAACHTSEITYKKTRLRIEGGSAMINIGAFQKALGTALFITNNSTQKFDAFAKRWLKRQTTLPEDKKDIALAALKKAVEEAVTKGVLEKKLIAELGLETVDAGYGRTDALSRIGNKVFGKLNSVNLTETVAPVNFPHVWDTPWFYWVQYNASIRLPMIRNIGEALGVGASVNGEFDSTVDVKNLHLMEDQIAGQQPFKGLTAPAWPEDVFGEIQGFQTGDGKWKKGKQLYEKHCIHCHWRIEDYQSVENTDVKSEGYKKYWTQPNQFRRKFMKLPFINFVDLGTDPAAVVDFYKRMVYTGSISDKSSTMSAVDALTIATARVRDRKYAELGLTAAQAAEFDGYRELTPIRKDGRAEPGVVARLSYKARPLNGIWATAPFLHNGSVANLYELLLPADQRMKTFYLGSIEFDPKHVGFDTKFKPGRFLMNTLQPGNLNSGHEFRKFTPEERRSLTPLQKKKIAEGKGWAVFGVLEDYEFSDDERWALIEYVKSLGSPQRDHEYPPSNESVYIEKLSQAQAMIQAFKVSPKLRGQHFKGQGVVKGTFRVEKLDARYQVGIFSEPGEFPATIRFSNGKEMDDRKKDVHGMAIKLNVPATEDDPATEQDFIMADNPVFFAKDVLHLLQFLGALASVPDDKQEAMKDHLKGSTHPKLKDFSKEPKASPLQTEYWSQTPYKFGELSVKYKVVPRPENAELVKQDEAKQDDAKQDAAKPDAAKKDDGQKSPNFLHEALVQRLTEPKPPAIFDFYIQVQMDAVTMPIEDASVEWDSDYVKLATITIPSQEFNTEQQKKLELNLRFNPWNAKKEHRPLGGLNRARQGIYKASQKVRYSANGIPAPASK